MEVFDESFSPFSDGFDSPELVGFMFCSLVSDLQLLSPLRFLLFFSVSLSLSSG